MILHFKIENLDMKTDGLDNNWLSGKEKMQLGNENQVSENIAKNKEIKELRLAVLDEKVWLLLGNEKVALESNEDLILNQRYRVSLQFEKVEFKENRASSHCQDVLFSYEDSYWEPQFLPNTSTAHLSNNNNKVGGKKGGNRLAVSSPQRGDILSDLKMKQDTHPFNTYQSVLDADFHQEAGEKQLVGDNILQRLGFSDESQAFGTSEITSTLNCSDNKAILLEESEGVSCV